jgi:site-specific DNA recombinase
MSKRAAIYVRISQDRNKGTDDGERGVDRQEKECRALAERLGYEVVKVYPDNDTSAYSGKTREKYEAMRAAIGAGAINAVIAWHPDRLHRSPRELEDFLDLIEARAVEIHTVQAGIWDLSTPSGRMVARQLGAVARYESEHKAKRIKAAHADNATKGTYRGGRRPFGYLTAKTGATAKGTLVKHPQEAPEVLRAVEQVAAGVSLRQIARDLNERGFKTTSGNAWIPSGVRHMVSNPRYAGLSLHEGSIVGTNTAWPAIVDEELWRAVNDIVNDPSRRTSPGATPRWLGSGIYLCGRCEQPALIVNGGPDGRERYRCKSTGTLKHVAREAELLDNFVEELVVERLSRPGVIEKILAGRDDTGGEAIELRAQAKRLRERKRSVASMHALGDIDKEDYLTQRALIPARIAEVEARLTVVGTRSPVEALVDAPDVRTAWFGEARRWQPTADRKDGLSLGQRRAIIREIVTVTVLPSTMGRRKIGAPAFNPEFIGIEWKVPPEALAS